MTTASLHDWGALTFSEVSGHSLVVRRTADLITRAPRDSLVIAVQVQGQSRIRQGALDACLFPGDVALYTSRLPYERRLSNHFRTIVVTLAATQIACDAVLLDGYAGHRLSGERGLGRILAHHLVELAHEAGNMVAGRESIVRSVAVLVDAAVQEQDRSNCAGGTGARRLHIRQRAARFIDEHIAQEGLDPQAVAAALYVSVRTLHEAFAGTNLTVAKLIKARRLEHAHSALADPLRRDWSMADIATASGFSNFSHFSKSYRNAFGQTPTQYRHDALRRPPAAEKMTETGDCAARPKVRTLGTM